MKKVFNLLILLGLVLGILGGLFAPGIMEELSFLGTIYINLLKFIIIPIIFTTIMVTVYNYKKEKKNLVAKSIILLIIMFIAIFLLTSLVVWLIQPANGVTFEAVEWDGETTALDPAEIITNLFPSNIVTMIANNSIFSCILVALCLGYAAKKVENGDKLVEVVEVLKSILYKILQWIIYLTPLGVFSLVGITIVDYGSAIIGVSARYIGLAYLCSILALILFMILPVWIYAKVNPISYVKKLWKVWLMTLTTCSSAATLPYAMKVCNEEFNIPEKTTNILVPLGATIHRCGGAVSFALLGLFCSQLFGVEITLTTYLFMIISATLINMSAPRYS